MYNSIVISNIVKLWLLILYGYKRSILKKTVDGIKKIIVFLFKGSFVIEFFTSRKSLIEKSIIFHLISKTTDFINIVFKHINGYVKKKSKSSIIYFNLKKIFSTKVDILRSFFIFIFFFGIGLVGNNMIRGFYSGRSYIIAAIFIIISLIGLALKENYKEILENSWIYRFVESIFTIDEGGGNWW